MELENALDVHALHGFEREHVLGVAPLVQKLAWQGVLGDEPILSQNHAPFNHVAQFPDIARPRIIQQAAHGPIRDGAGRLPGAQTVQEVLHQQRDVLFALGQGRDVDVKNIDAVE